jgi:hypothetical protein
MNSSSVMGWELQQLQELDTLPQVNFYQNNQPIANPFSLAPPPFEGFDGDLFDGFPTSEDGSDPLGGSSD